MSTLFFDGFDRGYLLKNLDPNYWSQQSPEFDLPRYSFAAWSYNADLVTALNPEYQLRYHTYRRSNNTIPPPAEITNDNLSSFTYINIPPYPGVGTPPGFLALNNIPINNDNDTTPIRYLQLSGFPEIKGSESYFGIRCLGIETKDHTINDTKLGRFGQKHPFLAFCSGSHTGLLLSFVRITGNYLSNLRREDDTINNYTGPQWTIGLQVEQNNGVSGIFDLNIADVVDNYRITPIYSRQFSIRDSVLKIGGIPTGQFDQKYNVIGKGGETFISSKILTIANDIERGRVPIGGGGNWSNDNAAEQRVVSRWVHFEVAINRSQNFIQIKAEDVDLLLIDDQNSNRDTWDFVLPISGFNYDNVRIFNRTYNSSLFDQATQSTGGPILESDILNNTSYYANGSLMLIDDVTLVDNTGIDPTFFLGKDSKILPLNPGLIRDSSAFDINSELFKDDNISDGPYQWNKNPQSLSNKSIVVSYDFDASKIVESKSHKINSNAYSNNYVSGLGVNPLNGEISDNNSTFDTPRSFLDNDSLWKYKYSDAIAGIKVYNLARKEFLDADFVNIIAKQGYTTNDLNTRYLLHCDTNNIFDYSWYGHDVGIVGDAQLIDGKFSSGLSFSNNIYAVITDENYSIGTGEFTLESWIKFDNNSDEIVLFDKKYKPQLADYTIIGNQIVGTQANSYQTQRPAGYSISVNTGAIYLKSWFNNYYDSTQLMCNDPAVLEFSLPQAVSTGVWHHVAVTKTNVDNSGYFTVFLNGVSGTKYTINSVFPVINDSCEPTPSGKTESAILYIKHPNVLDYLNDAKDYTYEFDVLSRSFGSLLSRYNDGQNLKFFPYTYIYGTGNIDEYRFSSGVVRYSSNFTPQINPHSGTYDGFVSIGPVHSLDATRHKTFQFYQMYQPETQQPFNISAINNGFKLGVKKL